MYAFVCLYKACMLVSKCMPAWGVCVCVCVDHDTWVYSISSVAACRLQEWVTVFFFYEKAQGRHRADAVFLMSSWLNYGICMSDSREVSSSFVLIIWHLVHTLFILMLSVCASCTTEDTGFILSVISSNMVRTFTNRVPWVSEWENVSFLARKGRWEEGEEAWKGKEEEKEELTSLHYFSFIFKLFLTSNN